ncbi:CrcB family protein [Gammaproteobacteria bacterium AB-CW1]|uniref:Fluoride-specific ion channel FluC n=1 Tax=Natronospira elongata TaxID=3110268 RepID=A0AAP6JD60_9GAMM|nr:CrcB family protein [Gammaproteobacteria bacterium AB-CW1]
MSANGITLRLLPFVALGGALGSGLRHGLQLLLGEPGGALMPIGIEATLTANLLGSLLIGALAVSMRWHESLKGRVAVQAFLLTGLLGGFTTASVFSLELLMLLESDQAGLALAYGLCTFLSCLLAAAIGYWLAWRVLRRPGLRRLARIRRRSS